MDFFRTELTLITDPPKGVEKGEVSIGREVEGAGKDIR